MVLNLSPLAAHLNESLTSLRFATKVRMIFTIISLVIHSSLSLLRSITQQSERQRNKPEHDKDHRTINRIGYNAEF